MFYVAYRTLLVMFCVLKIYFVDFNGMFTSFPTWHLKMHVLWKVRKNIIFQNKTLLVMFYRQNKTFWYQFCNFKHFLKAENSEDILASSCAEKPFGLTCNPVCTCIEYTVNYIKSMDWSLTQAHIRWEYPVWWRLGYYWNYTELWIKLIASTQTHCSRKPLIKAQGDTNRN